MKRMNHLKKNKQYELWVMVKKNCLMKPERDRFADYCTCAAGLLGDCIHIASALLMMELQF